MADRKLFRVAAGADKQPGAIMLIMDQMEAMAPRYAHERR